MANNNRKHKSAARRKEKYHLLMAAGFNSREANRYKDMSDAKIDSLIEERRNANQRFEKIAGGWNG